jgi:hypothetical protein
MNRDELNRTPAWGNVKRTKGAAIDDASKNLRRLRAESRAQQRGHEHVDEVRRTPTGWQARVSADLRRGQSRRD